MMKEFPAKTKKYIKEILYGLHPLTAYVDPRVKKTWVAQRSFVSNKWSYCYFRIPKCANSTVTRSLSYYDAGLLYDPAADPMGKVAKNRSDRLLSAKVLTADALPTRYFLFTFVRNPYARLLSAYMDKIARLDNPVFESTREAIRAFSDSKCDLTFEAFVKYLECRGLYENPHWVPQTSMLPIAARKIHFIGRVESLERDLEFIIDRVFGEGIYKGALMREVRRTDAVNKIFRYYNTELARRVCSLYQADFDAFSYSKILPSQL